MVAADDATFGLPEVRLGLVPAGGGTQLLVRRVGRSVARDLVLTGRRVGADEALRLGLADRVVPRAEALAAATALAAEIAGNAPTAVRMAKWALEVGGDLPVEAAMEVEDQAWRRAVLSDDRREGIAAWVEKRDPDWQRLASLRACSAARSSSNQTVQPSGVPSTPQRSERASNRSRPRPVIDSRWWTRRRGLVGPPPSWTSTRSRSSEIRYWTAKVPPLPEAECRTALVAASLTSSRLTSRAGPPAWIAETTKRRAAATWSACPLNSRRPCASNIPASDDRMTTSYGDPPALISTTT